MTRDLGSCSIPEHEGSKGQVLHSLYLAVYSKDGGRLSVPAGYRYFEAAAGANPEAEGGGVCLRFVVGDEETAVRTI